MSKSQNITSEQLTEQWKKGELPEGWYWVKIKTWCEYIDMLYYTSDIFLDNDVPVDNEEIIEVLAPVPSYEEWKEKIEENAQLKELLKECFIAINEGSFWDECEVLHKIEQALGEDK